MKSVLRHSSGPFSQSTLRNSRLTSVVSALIEKRISLDKTGYPHTILLISSRKHMLWYSLEASFRGTSNEYHNVCFRGEIRKISLFFGWKKCLIWSYGNGCWGYINNLWHHCQAVLCTLYSVFCYSWISNNGQQQLPPIAITFLQNPPESILMFEVGGGGGR